MHCHGRPLRCNGRWQRAHATRSWNSVPVCAVRAECYTEIRKASAVLAGEQHNQQRNGSIATGPCYNPIIVQRDSKTQQLADRSSLIAEQHCSRGDGSGPGRLGPRELGLDRRSSPPPPTGLLTPLPPPRHRSDLVALAAATIKWLKTATHLFYAFHWYGTPGPVAKAVENAVRFCECRWPRRTVPLSSRLTLAWVC